MTDLFAIVYAVGFVVTALVVAAANRPKDHVDMIVCGTVGLLAGVVWPLVAAGWAVGQVGASLTGRRPRG